ncbi:MAG: M55 family metallopeptidase [Bryobacteraceae bacterium]
MRLLALLTLAIAAACPAAEKLKVYISADMEGIGGVSSSRTQGATEGREYASARRLMTEEVNAAIQGAFDAGATDVVVSDSHGDGQNIDIELLDKRAKLIRAFPRPLGMMGGIDKSFDAVGFVGFHAAEGQADATLAHTVSGSKIFDLKLNGVSMPEAGLNAAIAAEFGVPVVFLSGDQTICAEARRLLGPIETAAVKQATSIYSAMMIHPSAARQMIREGMKRGIERRKEFKPYLMSRPVRLEITYKRTTDAEVVSYLPNVERPRGNAILFSAGDMIQISKFFNAIMDLNTF